MINLAVGIIVSLLLTRVLGSELWGQYNQISWLIGFLALTIGFGMTATIQRYSAFYAGRNNYSTVFVIVRRLFLLQLSLALGMSLILLAWADEIQRLLGWNTDPMLLRLASMGVISVSLHLLATSCLKGLLQFKKLALLSILNVGLVLIGTTLTCLFRSLQTLLVAVYCAQIILVLCALIILRRIYHEKADSNDPQEKGIWQPIVKYSLWVYLTILVDQIVWQKSEIFFLGKLPTAVESSYYGLAYTIAIASLGTLPAAITGILMPTFTRLYSTKGVEGIRKEYQRAFSYLNWILLPCFCGLIVIAQGLIPDLYGQQFTGAIMPLRILAISSALAIYTRPSGSVLHATNQPGLLLLGGVCAIPMDLFLAIKLVPVYGASGAAVANLFAQATAGISVVVYVSITKRISYDWKNLLHTMAGAIVSSLAAWSVVNHLPIPVFRLFVAILVGAICYVIVLYLLKERVTLELKNKVLSYIANRT